MDRTRRRILYAMAVGGMTTLAGCDSGDVSGENEGESTTTTTTSANQSDAALADFSYPTGYGRNGVTDTQKASENHIVFLTNASNYTANFRLKYERDGEMINDLDSHIRVSHQSEAGYWEYDDQVHTKEAYFDAELFQLYSLKSELLENPNQTRLFDEDPPEGIENISTVIENQFLQELFASYDFEAIAVTETGGKPAVKYSVMGVTDFSADAYSNLTGELVVRQDGAVKQLDVSYSWDESKSYEAHYELTDVGSTDLDLPSWVIGLQQVQTFLNAIDAGETTTVNEMIADESNIDEWTETEANEFADIAFENYRYHSLVQGDETIQITVNVDLDSDTVFSFIGLRIELQTVSGTWKIWNVSFTSLDEPPASVPIPY